MKTEDLTTRYFVTYSGVRLPLKLVNELTEEADWNNRNTCFKAYYNAQGQFLMCQKLVYGEVELQHRYSYHPNGALQQAEITNIDGEETVLNFDQLGKPIQDN